MKFYEKFLLLLIVLLFTVTCGNSEEIKVNILATSDTEGYLLPCG